MSCASQKLEVPLCTALTSHHDADCDMHPHTCTRTVRDLWTLVQRGANQAPRVVRVPLPKAVPESDLEDPEVCGKSFEEQLAFRGTVVLLAPWPTPTLTLTIPPHRATAVTELGETPGLVGYAAMRMKAVRIPAGRVKMHPAYNSK